MANTVRILFLLFFVCFSACRSAENLDYIVIPPQEVLTLVGECDIECNAYAQETSISFEKVYVDTISQAARHAFSLKKLRKLKLTHSFSYIPRGKDRFTGSVSVTLSARLENLEGVHIKTYHSSSNEDEGFFYKSAFDATFVAKAKAFQKALLNIFEQMGKDDIATLQDISEKKHKEKIKREREAREKAEKEQLIAEKKRIKFLIDKFGEKQASLIIEKRIGIGMAEEALIESWGKPRNINESTGPWGVHRQYVYHSAYVYIENGSVVSWQIEK